MKKAISLMIATMTMMVMLSACSVHGTPASLVGTWKVTEFNGVAVPSGYEYLMRFDSDDSVWVKITTPIAENNYDWTHTSDITKCTCTEITRKAADGSSETTDKYELAGNNLTLTDANDYSTKLEKQ